jgi:hypothetical protein
MGFVINQNLERAHLRMLEFEFLKINFGCCGNFVNFLFLSLFFIDLAYNDQQFGTTCILLLSFVLALHHYYIAIFFVSTKVNSRA